MVKRPGFAIGETSVAPGTRQTVDLPVSVFYDHTPVNMPVHVVHGKRDGPTLFVSAALHGDEIIGVEIVRRLLGAPQLKNLRGTLLAIPVVNSFGFLNHSRYLPDRRDLNRSFPGSAKGSLASRLAHLFMTEIAGRSNYGIDLHSAAVHRTNLPQIRVSPDKPETVDLAKAFGAPLILESKLREGSMRQSADAAGLDVLLYEAGEGLRFDETAVMFGTSGILRVMRHLGMIAKKGVPRVREKPVRAKASFWMRAPTGGLLRVYKDIGALIRKGDVLGEVSDPFGESDTPIIAERGGLLLGRAVMPIVNEGDGLFHIAHIATEEDGPDILPALDNFEDDDLGPEYQLV